MVRAPESITAFAAFLSSSPMVLLLRGMCMSACLNSRRMGAETSCERSGLILSEGDLLILRHHVRIGHREQQLAALPQIILLAGDDFFFEIPRQHHHGAGPKVAGALFRNKLEVSPKRAQPDFVGVALADIGHSLLRDPEELQQYVALGGGAEAEDLSAGLNFPLQGFVAAPAEGLSF